jgi:hypothetical protein
MDPRLLFVAQLLLTPVGVAVLLLLLLGIIHFFLGEPPTHSSQPPKSP